jgi:hypothetical protein
MACPLNETYAKYIYFYMLMHLEVLSIFIYMLTNNFQLFGCRILRRERRCQGLMFLGPTTWIKCCWIP